MWRACSRENKTYVTSLGFYSALCYIGYVGEPEKRKLYMEIENSAEIKTTQNGWRAKFRNRKTGRIGACLQETGKGRTAPVEQALLFIVLRINIGKYDRRKYYRRSIKSDIFGIKQLILLYRKSFRIIGIESIWYVYVNSV